MFYPNSWVYFWSLNGFTFVRLVPSQADGSIEWSPASIFMTVPWLIFINLAVVSCDESINQCCIDWHSILKPSGASVLGSSESLLMASTDEPSNIRVDLKRSEESLGWALLQFILFSPPSFFFSKGSAFDPNSIFPLSHSSLQLKGFNFRTRTSCISREKGCQSMQSIWQRSLVSILTWMYFHF